MTVDQLHLEPDVEAKALELQARAPGVVFTSGRRSLEDQARAMAQNVALRRDFIGRVYLSPHAKALQRWVDEHPQARTVAAIRAGLLAILKRMTPEQQATISLHLTGRAFDVKPRSCNTDDLFDLRPARILLREGGLERWHLQW